MIKKTYKIYKITVVFMLSIIFVISSFNTYNGYAAPFNKKISLSQAVSMGIAKSKAYKKTKSKIVLKEVKYKEAVKSIYLKKKNMSTFRWSPLLNFKFPEKATLAQEFEFTYKPLQIQSEKEVLTHQLTDIKYEVTEEISNLYTEIYTYQEKIKYKEELKNSYTANLKKNEARLILGEAKQSDIDKIKSSIAAVDNELAADKRTFEKDKSDLSDLIGLNVSSGYEFINPYVDTRIDRENLNRLTDTTLNKSQSYYEAKMTTKLALTSLDTNYNLMSSQYNTKMSYISSYVSQAKAGVDIDTDDFKAAYDNFLTAIDQPWVGKRRILFIRIPKEWFKGSIDGVRYVEDDPYILYANVLEYIEAVNDQMSLEKEIRKSVEDGFENIITAKNTYDYMNKQTDKAREDMEKANLKNKAGELSFEEYEEARLEYEELQISTMEALELYTEQLYSYDRLTCGGITDLLKNINGSMSEGQQGISNISDEESGIYYYINSIVEDSVFELGINITEDCETNFTHFELWIDGTQIGERTDIEKVIRHLTLDLKQTEKVTVRLYEDERFVADCEINPQEYQGRLDLPIIKKDITGETSEEVLGDYTYTLNKKTGITDITFKMNESLGIAYYAITDSEGHFVYSSEPMEIDKSMSYLSLLIKDLDSLRIILYGSNRERIATGRFDVKSKQIIMEE